MVHFRPANGTWQGQGIDPSDRGVNVRNANPAGIGQDAEKVSSDRILLIESPESQNFILVKGISIARA
ncbi:MAG: hypothetical protein LQ339_000001 [Xanthoria mediterranea]|nr:MAG: hypothetical protein LQ339_000001 [Xanthoria mediterranea]